MSNKWEPPEPSCILEAGAGCCILKNLCRALSNFYKHPFILSDAMAIVLAFTKGRSSSSVHSAFAGSVLPISSRPTFARTSDWSHHSATLPMTCPVAARATSSMQTSPKPKSQSGPKLSRTYVPRKRTLPMTVEESKLICTAQKKSERIIPLRLVGAPQILTKAFGITNTYLPVSTSTSSNMTRAPLTPGHIPRTKTHPRPRPPPRPSNRKTPPSRRRPAGSSFVKKARSARKSTEPKRANEYSIQSLQYVPLLVCLGPTPDIHHHRSGRSFGTTDERDVLRRLTRLGREEALRSLRIFDAVSHKCPPRSDAVTERMPRVDEAFSGLMTIASPLTW